MGEKFQDLSDVKVLLQALDLRTPADAMAILARYYALDRYPARARYILDELLAPKA